MLTDGASGAGESRHRGNSQVQLQSGEDPNRCGVPCAALVMELLVTVSPASASPALATAAPAALAPAATFVDRHIGARRQADVDTMLKAVGYDTVDALVKLARSDRPGPINIGNPVELSVLEIAEGIRDLAGSASPIEHRPAMEDDPRRRCPDISLATEQLGWQPRVSYREGLAQTIDWIRRRSCASSA